MIDPNEAPEGYVAVAEEVLSECTGCVFKPKSGGHCADSTKKCLEDERGDGQTVIFKEKEPEQPHDFKELFKGAENTTNYKAEKHFLAVGEIVAELAEDCDKYREALEDIRTILDKVLSDED